MSSSEKWTAILALRTGLPPRETATWKQFGTAARFGETRIASLYPFWVTTLFTAPGPTCALAPPTEARAFEGGGRLVSTAAASTAPVTSSDSPVTSRRNRLAAETPSSGRAVEALKRGTVRRRVTEASRSAAASNPILTSSALPYEVCQNEARVGICCTAEPVPAAIRTITDANATFEKRGTQTARPATRRGGGRVAASTTSPISPPSQTDPATRWNQSNASERARGEVWAA